MKSDRADPHARASARSIGAIDSACVITGAAATLCARLLILGMALLRYLRTAFAACLVSLNTLVHVPLLLVATLFKLVLPIACIRRMLTSLLTAIAESWVSVNSALIRALTPTRIQVHGDSDLRRDGRYLVRKG